MDLAELTSKASSAVQPGGDFTKKVKFDFGNEGKLFIDGAAGKVDNSDSPADATIKVDWNDFQKISGGQMDPTMAFMQGKLKVEGDMSVAMQLQSLMKKFS
ncbi:MAG: SCP2 sterol-binding domain-containing protein [Alphaproteobacteria bacterium]|uniref:SCP2 sterol-binding domain-containing protein n=1 Tax=Hyphomonas sp. TaxID=87 RepID=UPI001DCB3F8F|nr:SCP2 sterol-binding domain-containing protein [Alphaproteobacteria bacterium]MBU2084814.1 SCP2 sterol-binding domain-containing protein [Alphaproteobacteria bacterium]MBU2144108.1 SCP2 sterol-binding domain-containing protein [Alphaproteobacteria bacterium]MBU2198223.1 SCP2 sterol-binding domain-containing protein [Alphaproteobacteria bacterium]